MNRATDPRLPAAGIALPFHAPGEFRRAEPVEPVVWSLIKRGDLAVVYGPPGSGKSAILADLTAHVSVGMPWFGMQTGRGSVLYIAAERGDLTDRRLAAMSARIGEDLGVRLVRGRLDFAASPSIVDDVIATARAVEIETGLPLAAIVIDTLSRSSPSLDENSTAGMSGLVGKFDAIIRAIGAALIVLTHQAKGDGRMRGSTVLQAAADVVLHVTRSGNSRSLEVEKLSDGPEDGKFSFEICDLPELETSFVRHLAYSDAGNASRRKNTNDLKRLSRDTQTVFDALLSVTSVTGNASPQDWRMEAEKTLGNRSPEALRKAFFVAKKTLLSQGLITEAAEGVTVTGFDFGNAGNAGNGASASVTVTEPLLKEGAGAGNAHAGSTRSRVSKGKKEKGGKAKRRKSRASTETNHAPETIATFTTSPQKTTTSSGEAGGRRPQRPAAAAPEGTAL